MSSSVSGIILFTSLEFKHNCLTCIYSIYCWSPHLPFGTGSSLVSQGLPPTTLLGREHEGLTQFKGDGSCCKKPGRRKPGSVTRLLMLGLGSLPHEVTGESCTFRCQETCSWWLRYAYWFSSFLPITQQWPRPSSGAPSLLDHTGTLSLLPLMLA